MADQQQTGKQKNRPPYMNFEERVTFRAQSKAADEQTNRAVQQVKNKLRGKIWHLETELANARRRLSDGEGAQKMAKVRARLMAVRYEKQNMGRRIERLKKNNDKLAEALQEKRAMECQLRKDLARAQRQAARSDELKRGRNQARCALARVRLQLQEARMALAKLQEETADVKAALAEAENNFRLANQALELFRRSGPHGGYVRTRLWVYKEIHLPDGKAEVLAFERSVSATDAAWAAHDSLIERGCVVHVGTHKDVPRLDHVPGLANRRFGHIPIIQVVINGRECMGLVAFRYGEPAAIATGKFRGKDFIEDGGFIDLETFVRGR